MYILKCFAGILFATGVVLAHAAAQEPGGAAPATAKPTEHVLGTITAIDAAAQRITVKDDKSGTEYPISLAEARTLLRVQPGAKNVSNATRITAADLASGDRVDIRGFKDETVPNGIAARSVILMSARDLQRAHQAEEAAWQNSTAGRVTSVDPANGTISITTRTAEGTQAVTVHTSDAVKFTRYSPDTPKVPAASQIADIETGDQVRIIGQKSADGTSITAEKVYSGAFRTIPAVVSSISPDGKQITLKDLQTKQDIPVELASDSSIRKLPPPMAMMLARRFNPNFRPATTDGGSAGAPGGRSDSSGVSSAPGAGGAPPMANADQHSGGNWQGGAGGGGGGMRAGGGDISRLLERAPEISVSDLKPGDAVVVSGAAPKGKPGLIATSVIAGVEPIFQSAPPRQGQSFSADWSLDMSIPNQ